MKDPEFQEDIENALKTLQSGGVILYPTDTIWGLGCDATNHNAVEKIYRIKQRIESKSLIILIDSFEQLNNYVDKIPDVAYDLLKCIENPVTVIYSNAKNLASNVIAGDGTIGIRIVKEEFCINLISRFGKPIVSTSANISGEESPVIFSHISKDIISNVDYIVKYRQETFSQSKPSTIIRLMETGEYIIIRQ
ncbi:MAG TPA: L-threonylcarbamoyladenylate synthase [Bacteroidales bacterium]|nr:L-threonylcarbamoyladenylate synthase [Bacteroidales bacterium]HPT01687.1 L-threonylcarbamoyladenylate synthase [Bacteroidales bacterium]